MATPLTASKLLAALRNEGLVVHEVRNWRHHNRNTKGRWGPLNGVMIHHTVTKGVESSVDLCYDGHPDLPGPLCHGVIDKQGEIHLVGNGRANHAGLGDRDVLEAVVNEDAHLPKDDAADTDGNRHFYGFECINLGDGRDPWPKEQQLAIEKVSAAICRAHGWSERSVIGHKEWQPGKVDPRGIAMEEMRGRIKKRLAKGPADAGDAEPGGSGGPGDPGGSEGTGGTGGDSGDGTGRPVPPKPQHPPYEPFPGREVFRPGSRSPVITAMGARLVAEGCGHYKNGPGPEWTEADRKSYAAWQRKLGFRGKDADGVPGRVSWERLRVPNS
ncbi:N-acetylmuramoyl-L-alanine amidase [Streptomyces inhibens]|uniref:N-acetylmuramoyl-L-alanine amidase n=1 Tax=Streptomyces inhibens TaxID=2293571 RepID=A0A371PYZ5_STRIH|nr:peptidoglycan-binding protein [Streptomyces inhibens]REK87664.1 N-acetylmuramoyl-L-alanine amidase [Streptomyces inhibens]